MSKENRFCLVDSAWIPVVGKGRVSLMDVFSDDSICDIDGNAVQKIALTKFLIAVCQAAVSLKDSEEWEAMGSQGMSNSVRRYLEEKRDCFWLYGDKPFLQIPRIVDLPNAKPLKLYYYYLPDTDHANDTILNASQGIADPNDADKAVFLVTLMNYALGGKRSSTSVPLMGGADKKTPYPAPSLGGFVGYLQVCLKGRSLRETAWLNFFTEHDKEMLKVEDMDVRPPWEEMPDGESDERACKLKKSIYAWLVAVSRFVYLKGNDVYCIDGIQYPKFVKDGYTEPFIVAKTRESVLYVNPAEKPWRNLTAFLRAVYEGESDDGYVCQLLKLFLPRARDAVNTLSIWAGGLKVRDNSGDQSVKQSDDFVDSEFKFETNALGQTFYQLLQETMNGLNNLKENLSQSVKGYYKSLGVKDKDTGEAQRRFWSVADGYADRLIIACSEVDGDAVDTLVNNLNDAAKRIYDDMCTHSTSRQMYAWVKNTPKRIKVQRQKE